jgi:two-component system, OmpR family, response regulator
MNSYRVVASPPVAPLSHVILIVEDDPDMRSMLVTLFEDEGLAAVAIDNGPAAIVWLRAHRPGIVILDLTLSSVADEGVLQELRSPYNCAVPVITLTTAPPSSHDCGAWTHLSMPFMVGDLLYVVYTYLQQHSGHAVSIDAPHALKQPASHDGPYSMSHLPSGWRL